MIGHAEDGVDAPRRDAEELLRPHRVEAHRARGHHVAERQHHRRDEARHQEQRLDPALARAGWCAPSRRRAAPPSGTAMSVMPVAIRNEFLNACQKSASAKTKR